LPPEAQKTRDIFYQLKFAHENGVDIDLSKIEPISIDDFSSVDQLFLPGSTNYTQALLDMYKARITDMFLEA